MPSRRATRPFQLVSTSPPPLMSTHWFREVKDRSQQRRARSRLRQRQTVELSSTGSNPTGQLFIGHLLGFFCLTLLGFYILKCSKHPTLWRSPSFSFSPSREPLAAIFDSWPSVRAFQAVNKGAEGSVLSGRPDLRASPRILLYTPRPTLTHPMGLTYTLHKSPWERNMLQR